MAITLGMVLTAVIFGVGGFIVGWFQGKKAKGG